MDLSSGKGLEQCVKLFSTINNHSGLQVTAMSLLLPLEYYHTLQGLCVDLDYTFGKKWSRGTLNIRLVFIFAVTFRIFLCVAVTLCGPWIYLWKKIKPGYTVKGTVMWIEKVLINDIASCFKSILKILPSNYL